MKVSFHINQKTPLHPDLQSDITLKPENEYERDVLDRVIEKCPKSIIGTGRNPLTQEIEHVRIKLESE